MAEQEKERAAQAPETKEAAPEDAKAPEQPVPEEVQDAQAAEPTEEQQLADQVKELTDKWLRTMAEYDNFRKRSMRERDEIYPAAVAATVTRFLPIYDDFERALACETPEDAAEFRKGVEMIYTSLQQCFEALGVEVIDPAGEAFDPNYHNAVMQLQDPEREPGTVAQVLQKGYRIGDRILRHAMVQVVCE